MIFSYVLVLFTIHFKTLCWVGFYKYEIVWLSFESNVVNLVYTCISCICTIENLSSTWQVQYHYFS